MRYTKQKQNIHIYMNMDRLPTTVVVHKTGANIVKYVVPVMLHLVPTWHQWRIHFLSLLSLHLPGCILNLRIGASGGSRISIMEGLYFDLEEGRRLASSAVCLRSYGDYKNTCFSFLKGGIEPISPPLPMDPLLVAAQGWLQRIHILYLHEWSRTLSLNVYNRATT